MVQHILYLIYEEGITKFASGLGMNERQPKDSTTKLRRGYMIGWECYLAYPMP